MENFKMTEGFSFPKTTAEKVAANIAAIKLVKQLELSQKQATREQQEILARYVGWGGLANEFFDSFKTRFQEERDFLRELVSAEEYESMEHSSLSAYYTDPMVATKIWEYFLNSGFTGGNILDPSMGTGVFFATMPDSIMKKSTLYGVELDSITGAIAKQLFPEAEIAIQGFETISIENESFDLIISNIPFGDIRVLDETTKKPYLIHDYFVKKACNLVCDSGVVSFITSIGTADKRSGSILKEIQSDVDFLGGVRLPSDTFKSIAGTTVTSDILIFQKNKEKLSDNSSLFFKEPVRSSVDSDGRVYINPYFDVESHFSQQVLGNYEARYFNGATLSVKGFEGVPLSESLEVALSRVESASVKTREVRLPIKMSSSGSEGLIDTINIRRYEYGCDPYGTVYYRDEERLRKSSKPGELTYYQDDLGRFVSWDKKHSDKAIAEYQEQVSIDSSIETERFFHNTPVKKGLYAGLYKVTLFYERPLGRIENERIKGMIGIKHAYQAVIDIQLDSGYDQGEFSKLLANLNQLYDEFVSKNGFINSPVNARLFERDDRFSLIASLEEETIDKKDSKRVTYKKSEAFRRPLIRPKKVIKEAASPEDALAISLSEGRGVDLDFMLSLYPPFSKNEELLLALGDRVIPNPQQYYEKSIVVWEIKEKFLSGEVSRKKEYLKAIMESGDQRYNWQHYFELLEEVEPLPVTLVDIEFGLGSNWIPRQIVGAFAYKMLTTKECAINSSEAYDCILDTITGRSLSSSFLSFVQNSVKNKQMGIQTTDYHGQYRYGHQILSYMLDSDKPTVMMNIGSLNEPKMVINEVVTSELREIENKFLEEFKKFISSNEDVKKLVEDAFNYRFNRYVTRQYDGSHLTIDGLAKDTTLRPHQLDAVYRIIEDGRALLAHEVGTGKTLTMISAGFKLKELGLVNKPVYVVPTNLTAQFGQEIMRFYPNKKVFVTTERDFERSRRRLFIARMITGDYDGIVIGHSQFEKIRVSKERQELFYKDKIAEINEILKSQDIDEDDKRLTFKQLLSLKSKLKTQLDKLLDDSDQEFDDFIDFEQLGIDMLFVDEAHGYKNVKPFTRLGNVAGIGTRTAKKNLDMEMKVRSIQEEHDFRNIVFATGTPVSNSISEMYVMMNYIQPDVLEEHDLSNFDSWVGAFGVIENNLEINPTGEKFVSRKRFTQFNNLPELMKIYRRTTDIRMTEDLNLPVPEVERFAIKSELTEAQKNALSELVERTERIKGGGVDPSEDNMLKITSEARKLALDMRLLDSELYCLADNNKILQVVDHVERIYRKESVNKGTQMIFSDIGTPANNSFNIYHELKELMIQRGIPGDEIAFIHDATDRDAKLQLQRQMNAGDVRILIASTEKGGTGLNVQQRMKAIHHLDVPWKPSDIIQRNGRLVRQGNKYKKVQIFHYITTGSFDNYLWQIQETKLKYISQIMTSKTPVRSASDIDEQTMTASDFKAIATGNPYLKMKMEIDNEVELLRKRRRAWERDNEFIQRRYTKAIEQVRSLSKQLQNISFDVQRAIDSKQRTEIIDGEEHNLNPFSMVFPSGKVYTKKDVAGNQLAFDIQTNISSKQEFRTIATYRGFELKAATREFPYRNNEIVNLYVVGHNHYPVSLDFQSALGTITRINNVIDNLERTQKHLKEDLTYYENIVKKGSFVEAFSHHDRLDYLSLKQQLLSPLIAKEADVEEIEEALRTFEEQMGTAKDSPKPASEGFCDFYQDDEVETIDPILDFTKIDEFINLATEFLNKRSTSLDSHSLPTQEIGVEFVEQLAFF